MLAVVPDGRPGGDGGKDDAAWPLIDEIVREGARRMLAEALRAEVDACIAAFAGQRGEDGRRLVVRNGYHQSREVLTSACAIEVTAPRVNDKRTEPATGERMRFSSAILPPWARKTPKITEVLPLLCLHGLSCGDFVPALGQFLGLSAGLSAAVITRLAETWTAGQRAFAARDLSGVDYVCLWADGIHVNIGLEEHKLCLLVMIGVRAGGRKELIALAGGYRESTGSWADLLRDCASRGMRAPVLVVGDGALGLWDALGEVFPEAGEGRCWFHKTANVLAALPKSARPGAKKALAEIWDAEVKAHAHAAVKAFEAACGAKFRAGAVFHNGVLIERPRTGRGMISIALRPATPADSEFCYQLHKAAMGDYITAIWGWDEQVQRGFHARAFNPGRWQIITADETDAGMLDVEHRPGEIYLARIEVHPAYQGHGIGTRLISALIDEATQKGQDLVLDVLTVNHHAQALYQRLGMTEVARHGDGNIKITMRSSRPHR